MVTNAFINKPEPPSDTELAAALGSAKCVWDQLLADLDKELGAGVLEWKCHSPKWGWSLRVKRKSRTIVWLGPAAGCFNVAFILGDKAVQAARQGKLPQRILKLLDQAPKYPEGTGLRLVAKTLRDLPALEKLAAIKVAN